MFSKLALGLALCLAISPELTAAAPSTLLQPSAMAPSTELSAAFTAALAAEMDAYVQAHADHRQFMGTVMVMRGGEPVMSRGYGMADLAHQVPHSPDTRFRIGSMTKQFTAAAILQLQDRGLVDVQAPVATYLPDYPNPTITLHHLLTHAAGLPNLTSFPDFAEWMDQPTTLDALIARFQDLPLEFEPGSQHRYSNSGYVLLTKVIETVSGQSYADYVTENLFAPLGMENTGYDLSPVPGLARGYTRNAQAYQPAALINMAGPQGAGGLHSTVGDLARWNQALFGDVPGDRDILSQGAIAAMTAPQVSLGIAAAPGLSYGYGLVIDNESEQPRIGHGGGINGFVSSLLYLPQQDATIVVLSNVESINPEQISAGLAAIALGESYDLPQALDAVTVDAAVLERYVGTYQLAPEFQITITVEDGQLYAQGRGQPAIALYPASDTEFFALAPELRIVFNPAESGAVESLTLIQGGQNTVAPRVN
ncbi:MAG: serine hydrolase [Leptolyngbya sp.]|nr:MAG: serine hydrolase [Leptolyngbya sp.]